MHYPRHSRRPSTRPILFALLKPRRTRLPLSPSTTPARRTTPCPTTLGTTLSDSNLSHTIDSRTPRSRHRPIQTGTLQYQSIDSSFESTRDRFEDARYLPRLSTIKERNLSFFLMRSNAYCANNSSQSLSLSLPHVVHEQKSSRPRTHSLIPTPPSGGNVTALPAPSSTTKT